MTTPNSDARVFTDPRGTLTLINMDEVPFSPARAYVLSEIPAGARRGGRACRTQHRFLLGVQGSARLTLDDGRHGRTLTLTGGDAIHIEPAVWHEIEAVSADVTILVFADGPYDPDDYVADRAALPLDR